ncbi:MAG: hypothetical protein OXK76_18020 [Gammaproteobacteria bacterium]|nr:hypothetical protein [Gammaproteobacteria bacterium]
MPAAAQTKGKVERPIRYTRESFHYGRDFVDGGHVNDEVEPWLSQVANVHRHETTGERPVDRFERDERDVPKPLARQPYRHQGPPARRCGAAAGAADRRRTAPAARLRGAGPMSAEGDRRDRPHAGRHAPRHYPRRRSWAAAGSGSDGAQCGIRASGGQRFGKKKADDGVVMRRYGAPITWSPFGDVAGQKPGVMASPAFR